MSTQSCVSKPPVPRRTQSVKVVRNYTMPNQEPLSNAPDSVEDPSKYRKTRPLNRKSRSRNSLDQMEQQASELLGFLSELENKKQSCNDNDFLSFLSDSKKVETGKIDDFAAPKSDKPFSDRNRRISVKDRAKLFLKPDIQEEPNEISSSVKRDRNLNHVKKFQRLSLPPPMLSCDANIKA